MKQTTSQHGFTLVEIIVSLSIFIVVAIIALGALIKIVNANAKAQTLQSAFTNLNFALDGMSRGIRLGHDVHCESTFAGGTWDPTGMSAQGCTSSKQNQFIAFYTSKQDSKNTCFLAAAYYIASVSGKFDIQKAQQSDCGQVFGSPQAPFTEVISPNISITNYELTVNYDSSHPNPNTFISLSGYAGVKESQKTYFTVETDVSSRPYH